MNSTVVVDIDAPQEMVAALFADPSKNVKWMEDVERSEPISGEQGMPGSTYRLVPKKGSMLFVATVVSRSLPNELRLTLDASNVTLDMHGTLSTLPDGRTRLVSEEEFRFKGLWRAAFGLLAWSAIRKAHRRHIEAFKRFAENERRVSQ
jgi:polyketide cyclase/dehydrase/lipid transport protein